jgi:hypothetical protein
VSIKTGILNEKRCNILITKHEDDILNQDFINTSMDRGYTKQKHDEIVFLTTHLESVPINSHIRNQQSNEIITNENDSKLIIFGDTNFTQVEETFDGLNYIDPISKTVFSYDSLYNMDAIPPHRNNIDRFYTNFQLEDPKVEILNTFGAPDQFPLLMTFDNPYFDYFG